MLGQRSEQKPNRSLRIGNSFLEHACCKEINGVKSGADRISRNSQSATIPSPTPRPREDESRDKGIRVLGHSKVVGAEATGTAGWVPDGQSAHRI